MSYPQAVATGNVLIRAALDLAEAHMPNTSTFTAPATFAFLAAVSAHREATAREHVQGPDIDAAPSLDM